MRPRKWKVSLLLRDVSDDVLNRSLGFADDLLRDLHTFEGAENIDFVLQFGMPISRESYLSRIDRLAFTAQGT